MLRKRLVVVAVAAALSIDIIGAAAAQAENAGGNRSNRTHARSIREVQREPAVVQTPAAGRLNIAKQEDAAGPGSLPQRRNWGACGVGHWGADCRR